MNKTDFVNQLISYKDTKLETVKLINTVSKLGLKISKDIADKYFGKDFSVLNILQTLERDYNITFETKLFSKTALGLEFTKLQLRAKEAGLGKYFEYLCESTIDESFSNTVEENKVQEDKRSDEVIH